MIWNSETGLVVGVTIAKDKRRVELRYRDGDKVRTCRHGERFSNIERAPAFVRKSVAVLTGIPGIFPAMPETDMPPVFWRKGQ